MFGHMMTNTNTNTSNCSNDPIEVMFLEPEAPTSDPGEALNASCVGQMWRCMVRCDAKSGDMITVMKGNGVVGELSALLRVEVISYSEPNFVLCT